MQKCLILIIMLILTSVVLATQIQVSDDNLTWENLTTNYTFYQNETNRSIAFWDVECEETYYFRAKNTTHDWSYDHVETNDCEANVESLAITVFILVVTGGLFALPFIAGRFSRNDILDMILKRGCWLVAIYLMMMNSAIMMAFADDIGLGVGDAMFRYLWLFGWAGYAFMLFIFVKTFYEVLGLWKENYKKARMGDDDEDEEEKHPSQGR